MTSQIVCTACETPLNGVVVTSRSGGNVDRFCARCNLRYCYWLDYIPLAGGAAFPYLTKYIAPELIKYVEQGGPFLVTFTIRKALATAVPHCLNCDQPMPQFFDPAKFSQDYVARMNSLPPRLCDTCQNGIERLL